MNWEQIKGNWTELKGRARERWGELTDDDLARVEGERDQLVGLVRRKYGVAKAEAERQVDAWHNDLTGRS